MKFKKGLALLCAALIGVGPAVSCLPATEIVQAQTNMTITESGGYMEGAYAEWTNTENVDGYNVYYKNSSQSEYSQKADAQLIRRYEDYYRVDIPGLLQGSYDIKIAAVKNGAETEAVYTDTVNVSSHKREGFAFSSQSPNGGNASGGYNADGSVPADAQIFYITQDNIDTITATIGKKSYKGLGNIIEGISKVSNPDEPNGHYIIRIIGKINGDEIAFEGSVNESSHIFYLQELANVTVEGIGEDATMYRSAFVIKGSSNVELRNLGMMLFLDDGIAVEGDNSNIWVHNNDIFYGSPGADSDQVKGDGSLDIKNNTRYCTLSYNHFWESGKASLVIASASKTEDTTSYLSYHHNWFDHSDSRHPRIRFATVHMYNNYFDGNAKYGTGVTSGASAFVEANYYRNPKGPMLSSMQGNDSGTFSKEAGGIIKAYNNYFDGEDPTLYYSADTGSDFDAYLVSERDEQVPSSVKTKLSTFKGITYNSTYNNFDTAATMYEYTPDAPQEVASIVEASAGRVGGGDFEYEFDDKEADRNSDIDDNLKSMLKAYTSPVKATYTGVSGEYYPAVGAGVTPAPTATPTPKPTATPVPTATPTPKPTATPDPNATVNPDATATPEVTPAPTETQEPATELVPVVAQTLWTYEDAAEEYTETTIYKNSRIYANSSKNVSITTPKYDTVLSKGLKLNGGGVPGAYRCVEILPGVAGTLTVNFESTGGSSRTMQVAYNEDEILGEMPAEKEAASLNVELEANKSVYIYSKSNSLTICSMVFTPSEAVQTPSPTATPEATTAPTAEPTATPEVTTAPTIEPSATPEATTSPTATPEATTAPTVEPSATPEATAAPEYDYFINEVRESEGIIYPEIIAAAQAQTATAYIAQYDEEGRLIKLDIREISVADTAFEAVRRADTFAVKCFVWRDMEPVSNVLGLDN